MVFKKQSLPLPIVFKFFTPGTINTSHFLLHRPVSNNKGTEIQKNGKVMYVIVFSMLVTSLPLR